MSTKYCFHKPDAAYFISFATVNWVDVFTREIYFRIITDSIQHCRENKGMELFAYCIDDPAGLIRDFKGFTSRKIIATIKENPKESRKEYLLKCLRKLGGQEVMWRNTSFGNTTTNQLRFTVIKLSSKNLTTFI